ncbi:hypothetical protein Dalk_4581 [Desulfatibacillum aliphaticivorans]|uniref:Uncharacterized protein n=1 Tax=Desulfatibacillum aliphaticivorans TaxID=218208 RepID=B8FNH8_DESAL|nr:crossover junction endodeoxyribonuclease RuvC [Desulfatibacillum aliphaticivorans]ACL06259.1 hypothetical protein Dalk_4581 [Desulfatibacillum aliphaticivorans]
MILALDVGLSNTGYCVFENGKPQEWGVCTTSPVKKKTVRVADDRADRSASLARQIRAVVEKHGVTGIVGELPSGGAQSAKAMGDMTQAVGIVAATAALLGIPAEWCTPTDVKKAATGKASASKEEIADAMAKKYGLEKVVKHTKESKKTGKRSRLLTYGGIAFGNFEHIADAMAAYNALAGGILVTLAG